MARKHHGLVVWQEAMALVQHVYELTAKFPDHERFALSSQMRRAAVSVPSNIAEGAGRHGAREFARFLLMARGSLSELETQVIISKNLGYVDSTREIEARIDKLFALLAGLLNSMNRKEKIG